MRNLWVLLAASALIALGEDMEEGLEMKVPLLGPILLAVQAALAAAADLVDAGALPYPKGPCEVRNVSKRASSAIFRLLMLHRKTTFKHTVLIRNTLKLCFSVPSKST